MKKIICFIPLFFIVLACAKPVVYTVSENNRYLEKDGKPFFWLGDTAWELFHRLDRNEADMYLQNRADKGFTVIQAVVLAELNGLNEGNAYGDMPLINNDPTQPNEKYFKHVDYIVNKAEKLGLCIGMLPTWGDKFNKQWGVGPEVFTPENAEVFGAFLSERYKEKPIIWILGGDRWPEDEEDSAINVALAKGILQNNAAALITYHPSGGSMATDYFEDADWLDFDFYQSGHHRRQDGLYLINFNKKSFERTPMRPVINGEPNYEDHPVDWLKNGPFWFDDFDCRFAAYISMLSGACGHTYGDHNIWQMWSTEHKPVSFARTKWTRAMDYQGAFQMGLMRKLFESLPWEKLVTGSYQILNESTESFQICTLANDEKMMLAYTSDGSALTINLDELKPRKVDASWFNPRDGEYMPIGEYKTQGEQTFEPHSHGRGSDWILVLK